MLLMFYLLITLTIIFNLIVSQQVFAQSFQFTIPNNNISFSRPNALEFEQDAHDHLVENEFDKQNEQFYLISQDQQFQLKELFKTELEIDIDDTYVIEFTNNQPLAIVFDYLIESAEDLLAFDEPAFYITVEGNGEKELIFAKTIAQSAGQWQKVVLDLSNYKLTGKKLVFHAGNFIDQEKTTIVSLKNLSSQIIVWHDTDRLFFGDQEIPIISDDLTRGYITVDDQIWPIAQFEKTPITDLEVIGEVDGSLTLLFSPIEQKVFSNHQCNLICDEDKKQLLKQVNYYLLPQTTIKDFWPMVEEKVLLNIRDFPCNDFSQLTMECL
jgi:hypothetical protein